MNVLLPLCRWMIWPHCMCSTAVSSEMLVDCVWNVMAHAQKPDFIFWRNMSPFKSAGASVQSTTCSQGVRIGGSNAGYTMFRGSVKGTAYPLHLPVSPSLPSHVPSRFYWTLHISQITWWLMKDRYLLWECQISFCFLNPLLPNITCVCACVCLCVCVCVCVCSAQCDAQNAGYILMQPTFKFLSSANHLGHLIMAPKG
jgi:hypothetical protein